MSDLINQAIAESLSDEIQELIIMPTEQCNFRCTYCYEDFSIGRMSKEIINGIKILIDKRIENLKLLHISWFGGEPLVAKDIVLNISEHAYRKAKEHGVLFQGSMTTNGYNLNSRTFSSLVNAGVTDYQISLDGPRDIHNQTRLRADGEGTFDKIWDNMIYIRNSKLDVSIVFRVHLDVEKIRHVDSLIEDIRREFLTDSRFSIMLKPIEKLGGENDENLNILTEKQRKVILENLYKKINGNSHQRETMPYICYASKPNSLVIRANGGLAKCTVALNNSYNNIGKINPDGSLNIYQHKLNPWFRGIKTGNLNILGCPLQYLNVENY
ncbi:radical SAM protein [Priestia megaterium]